MSYRRAIHRRSRFRASPPHIQGTAISLEVPRLGRPPSLPFEAKRFARLAKNPFVQLLPALRRKNPRGSVPAIREIAAAARSRSAANKKSRKDTAIPLLLRQPACAGPRSICAATAGRVPIGQVMSGHAPLWTTRLQVMRDALPRVQSRAGTVAASIPAVPIPCAKPARSQPALRTRRRPETGHDRETLQGRRSVRASL